ncbi:MAG TPA: poly-beta-1,6 N-acetyl-D-glucosamine export porin PgaA, partial [Pseudomonadales bacterium]
GLALLGVGLSVSAAAATASHEAAIQLARAGEFEQSISMLSMLHDRAPPGSQEALTLRQDLGVAYSWMGDDDTAIRLLAATPLAEQPDHVLAAYAGSLHRNARLNEAEQAYRAWTVRDPEALKPAIGLFYTLVDAHRLEPAAAELDRLQRRFDDQAVDFAAAYLARANGEHVEALRYYTQILRKDPDNADALRARAVIAMQLGAPWQAKAIAEAHPGILTDDELERVLLDTAAYQLRWSTHTATTQSEQIALSEEARRTHRHLLAGGTAATLSTENPIDRALLFDSLIGMTTRYDMAGAVELFESPPFQQVAAADVPTYVLAAAARAYLYLEEPLAAIHLYGTILEREPDSSEAAVGMFYACNDVGRYEEANRILGDLLNREPSWIRPTSTIWLENPRYADAVRLNAISPAYWGDYQTALERLDDLLHIAPADNNARWARARVLRWRGWPQSALKEAERILSTEPRSVVARNVRFHALMDRYRFDQAQPALRELDGYAPFDSGVRNATARWALHTRPELTSEAGYGHSDGTAIASDEWSLETYLYSSPISTHYRLFAHDLIRKAEFVEGSGTDHRLGAGGEYRRNGVRLTAELSGGFENNTDPGLAVGADWQITDRWSAGGSASLNSIDVPLRATRVGIRGDGLSLTTAHRWHERRSATLTGALLDMDDGNFRGALSADYVHPLLTRPRQQLDTRISAYTSRNSGGDRIYFNPERDLSAAVGVEHRWLAYTRHDQSLTQSIGADVGNYWQRGYGGGFTWTLRIAHDWRLSSRLNLSYGASTGVRVYDGDREDTAAVFLSLRSAL